MKIQLSNGDFKAASQNWNTLVNSKNKNKNYFIPTSIEEYKKIDKFTPRLQINFRDWILLKDSIAAFNEVSNRIYKAPELKGVVSYRTVCTALTKELEVEISNRDKDPKSKRDFVAALESIQNTVSDDISHFDFFFSVEGLELKDLNRISCNKVEIFAFNQDLCDQMIAAHLGEIDSQNQEALAYTQDFFNKNFLNRLCIKSTAYGDSDTANKKAYKQARELINYFRYILCLLTHDRASEQMIKINFYLKYIVTAKKL